MYLMLCFEYFNSRISILDCVTSPGYNLHFARRVRGALTPLETLPHQSSPWSCRRDGVKRVREEEAEIRLSSSDCDSETWAPVQKGTWAPTLGKSSGE